MGELHLPHPSWISDLGTTFLISVGLTIAILSAWATARKIKDSALKGRAMNPAPKWLFPKGSASTFRIEAGVAVYRLAAALCVAAMYIFTNVPK